MMDCIDPIVRGTAVLIDWKCSYSVTPIRYHNRCQILSRKEIKENNTQIAHMTKLPNDFVFILKQCMTIDHLCCNTNLFLKQHQNIMLEQATEKWFLSKRAFIPAQTAQTDDC